MYANDSVPVVDNYWTRFHAVIPPYYSLYLLQGSVMMFQRGGFAVSKAVTEHFYVSVQINALFLSFTPHAKVLSVNPFYCWRGIVQS